MAHSLYKCVSWLDDKSIDGIPTSGYWNDESVEKGKVFDISGGDFSRLQTAIEMKGILPQVEYFCNFLPEGGLVGKGISLGAGVCWLETEILKKNLAVAELTCLEFSRHRIFTLAPQLLAHEGIAPNRVILCLGSFYDLKIQDKSLDFVILCQAFHHAAEPSKLIIEILRVLKPGGFVLIVGEHFYGWKIKINRFVKHIVKWGINFKSYRERASFFPKYRDLFPPDPVKGDVHYSLKEYGNLFQGFGFKWIHTQDAKTSQQGFLLSVDGS